MGILLGKGLWFCSVYLDVVLAKSEARKWAGLFILSSMMPRGFRCLRNDRTESVSPQQDRDKSLFGVL